LAQNNFVAKQLCRKTTLSQSNFAVTQFHPKQHCHKTTSS
jgi:hypothetical protein